MGNITLVDRFYRTRSKIWRDLRVLFPSPAELYFIKMMGGTVLTIPFIKDPRTGFPMARVITMGKFLNSEMMAREVRVGKYWVDFGAQNAYYKKGIEIDGAAYHNNIIVQIERDEYFAQYGWQVLHIAPIDMYTQPNKVKMRVLDFFAD